ncbi:peptidoglycan DD-metalloendopeptidase family protein [Christensenella tenuis]|uniref:Peptidoglycan DD-metalloendopeptidase family protein n=1 Tax=Christensenella tenuis TaxID=2763033 RepID=A0ABR7EH35_9FIRM|nr:peptidoglycan DD-metalloendopeptidase family protein [Christensenella tenuis]MBC5648998.1 peptidoglycan DD-metalloendopeptidase family protein [Christensenella tenuis]
MKKLVVFVLAAALVLGACSSGPAVPPEPPETAQASAPEAARPTSAPQPAAPPDIEELVAEFPFEYPALTALYPRDGERSYEIVINNPDVTDGLKEACGAWMTEVSEYCARQFEASYGNCIWKDSKKTQMPPWQVLAAAALACETPGEFLSMLKTLVTPSVAVTAGGEGEMEFEFALVPKTPQEAFPLSAVKGDPIPSEFFTSTYLLTVYDEAGELRENSGALVELSERLTFPFAERYGFNDCWYDDRDGGARRHTGTDILCPEGTPELACVDGVILAVGGGEGTGNYVVLEGADGTQYHYYHMVEVSQLVQPGDTVKRGDPVGLAGNTGNSTANHLHIAVIAPGGVYVNPYPYLADAEDAPQP